jgi:hypothetical protein
MGYGSTGVFLAFLILARSKALAGVSTNSFVAV